MAVDDSGACSQYDLIDARYQLVSRLAAVTDIGRLINVGETSWRLRKFKRHDFTADWTGWRFWKRLVTSAARLPSRPFPIDDNDRT